MRDLTDAIRPTQYNGFCQNCAEKDQSIKELEEQIEKFKKGEIIPVSVAEQSFKMRDKELELYEKALELACLKIYSGNISDFDYVLTPQNIEAHFLQQAKEKINE